jgi:hypothetical protein
MLDHYRIDCVCVCVCVCVCSVCLCGQPGSFGTSVGQVHGTWEQYHYDEQINTLQVYRTKNSCQTKQILKTFQSLLGRSIAFNMRLMPHLSNTPDVGTLHDMHIC